MSEERESQLCTPTHEILLLELEHITEKLKERDKDFERRLEKFEDIEKQNTVYRLRTEGSVNVIKFLGVMTIVTLLAAVYKLFN